MTDNQTTAKPDFTNLQEVKPGRPKRYTPALATFFFAMFVGLGLWLVL